MQIKDVRQFRSFYKQKIREDNRANRNEHFIGTRHQQEDGGVYGFFDIYHGDKEGHGENDGIRGFLEGFLDMAKDGQAVYEFMQNAVDANSSRFALFWGLDEEDQQPYLLVVNNGEMFDMESIRSILNVGVSTKSADAHTIGKFGIGFKLAHRLVGKENGLDELIHQNFGPVLFSWRNHEWQQLAALAIEPDVKPVSQTYVARMEKGKMSSDCLSPEPWLFKILITNFPCLPENDTLPEQIQDYKYRSTRQAFSKAELQAMGRCVAKVQQYLPADAMKEGSIFYMRLGQGKKAKLEEDNLLEGVRFSLAILNRLAHINQGHAGLQEVRLNQELIVPPSLSFLPFKIPKSTQTFRYIRFGKTDNLTVTEQQTEHEDADIELLFGYTSWKEGRDLFTNAPSFYLFFPLSEEKHPFRFIIHSNAFHKSSSRTYLQPGSAEQPGINERLFEILVQKLIEQMNAWSASSDVSDQEKYLEVYANLLLSQVSTNPERQWVNKPLWEPLLAYIQSHIPVKDINGQFQLCSEPEQVKVKASQLHLEQWCPPSIRWFWWGQEVEELYLEAFDPNKLGIAKWTVLDLLHLPATAERINAWLEQHPRDRQALLSEIEKEINSLEGEGSEFFQQNLCTLDLWEFQDRNYAIDELAKPEIYATHLLMFENIDPLRAYLGTARFKLSILSLSDFPQLGGYIFQYRFLDYRNSFRVLIEVLSNRFIHTDFTSEEKCNVFYLILTAIRKGIDTTEDRIKRLRELSLFRNNSGKIVPLKHLLKESEKAWLNPWVVHKDEYTEALEDYLIHRDGEIYEQIIYPHWEEIAIRYEGSSELIDVFQSTQEFFNLAPTSSSLSGQRVIATAQGLLSEEAPYYYSAGLHSFKTEQEYQTLTTALGKLGVDEVPLFGLLPFYRDQPFRIDQYNLSVDKSAELSMTEAQSFLGLCKEEWPGVFQTLGVYWSEGQIQVAPLIEGQQQITAIGEKIRLYIEKHYEAKYVLLPPALSQFEQMVPLGIDKLFGQFIRDCDVSNNEQFTSLLRLVMDRGNSIKQKMLESVSSLVIAPDQLNKDSAEVLFVSLLMNSGLEFAEVSKLIHDKLIIQVEAENYPLSEALYTNKDELIITRREMEYKLSIADILIDADSRLGREVEHLVHKLDEFEVDNREVLEHSFGLQKQAKPSHVFSQLKELLRGKPIQNAQQLAFLLLYKTRSQEIDLGDFFVTTRKEQVQLKDVVLYCTENQAPYTEVTHRLTSDYYGLESILKLNQTDDFKVSDLRIVSYPFLQGSSFMAYGLSSLTEDRQRLSLLERLYQQFEERSEGQNHIDPRPNILDWQGLLGFDPEATLMASDALPKEQLPAYALEWLEQSEVEVNSGIRRKLLEALNVSFSGSDIARARKYLMDDGLLQPELQFRSRPLIRNTIEWISVNELQFSSEDYGRLGFIKNLYSKAEFGMEDIPTFLPVITDKERLSFGITRYELNQTLVLSKELEEALKERNLSLQSLNQIESYWVVLESLLPDHLGSILLNSLPLLNIELDKINEPKLKGVYSKEWNLQFYNEWKTGHTPRIYLCEGPIPYLATYNQNPLFAYERGDLAVHEGNIYLNGDLIDRKLIELIEEHKVLSDVEYSRLKEAFENYEYNIQHVVSRMQSDDKLREEWESLESKFQEQELKKKLTEEFAKSAKYSVEWFTCLLDLMVRSSKQSELNDPKGELVFSRIEYNDEDLRIIALKNPSKLISPNIEQFSGFKSEFYWQGENGKEIKKVINLKGVSKKEGQCLYALPSDENDLKALPLKSIKRVVISFSREIDLLKRLQGAFRSLNLEAEKNLKDDLTGNIEFVFGPPGTGKTTHLASWALNQMRSKPKQRILILTPTNKAADVLAERILKMATGEDMTEYWLARYGTTASAQLIGKDVFYDGLKFDLQELVGCVLITTIHRYPYEKIKVSNLGDAEIKEPLDSIVWDTIVFDEASMIPLPYIIYTFYKGVSVSENTAFIVGGDPLQIPPVAVIPDEAESEDLSDPKEENIYSMIGLRSFKQSEQLQIPRFGNKITNLTTQYRSIESIGDLFSRFQYHGLLKHGRVEGKGGPPNPRTLPKYFQELGFKPITIIRYPVNTLDTLYQPQKINSSPIHLYSAFLINELIRRFHQEIPNDEQWNIGTICPYRAQANLMNKMIESQTGRNPNLNTVTDTVHGFQGDQCDLVFALFNPSSATVSYSRFLKKEFIINVAISRAQDYLVLLLPDEQANGITSLRHFHEYYPNSVLHILRRAGYQDQISEISANLIERSLMGTEGYFERNSFTNAHQNVNVYGEPEVDYMVRLGGSAIDVHWKNNQQ